MPINPDDFMTPEPAPQDPVLVNQFEQFVDDVVDVVAKCTQSEVERIIKDESIAVNNRTTYGATLMARFGREVREKLARRRRRQ
ncbi:hypothetical protein KKH03_03200 [Patescibacteria group bacterium]|nr:hypothetical protein [Patescibacteria group bacterium]